MVNAQSFHKDDPQRPVSNLTSHIDYKYKFLSLKSLHELFGDFTDAESIGLFRKSGQLFLNNLDNRLNSLEEAIRKNKSNRPLS